jgi:hypothetical protein
MELSFLPDQGSLALVFRDRGLFARLDGRSTNGVKDLRLFGQRAKEVCRAAVAQLGLLAEI